MGAAGGEAHAGCPLPSTTSASSPRRTVLMLLDAWKWDFLEAFGEMEYVRRSIATGDASVLRARVQTPTVTMPRIKALTSGSVPSFASILLNFHSAAAAEPSWPRAAKEAGRRLVFFGDDTWLALFPDVFETRSEGVVSFFVTDYTQVDHNVTRRIDAELTQWERGAEAAADVLILHFLGLDHIGHSLGGESAEIPGKLLEMDGVVRKIHEGLLRSGSPFLFTILGDHGMTKAGNHGGSSLDETRVPVVVYRSKEEGESRKEERKQEGDGRRTSLTAPPEIEQLDVASFLSHELGVAVPGEALGVTYHDRIGFDAVQSIVGLTRDVQRLSGKVPEGEARDSLASCAHSLASLLGADCRLRPDRSREWRATTQRCYALAKEAQSSLISAASRFDALSMLVAIAATAAITLFLLHSLLAASSSFYSLSPSTLLALPIHFLSFFASSLVEEEHDVWYFLLSTSLLVEVWRRLARKDGGGKGDVAAPLTALLLHRCAVAITAGKRRRWNMAEDLFPPPILADLFEERGAGVELIPPSVWSLVVPLLFICLPDRSSRTLRAVALAPLVARSLGYCSPQVTACVVWATFAGGAAARVAERLTERRWLPPALPSPLFLLLPLLLSLARAQLLPVAPLAFQLGRQLARCRDASGLVATALSASFFYTGGGNSLSTIDIAAGYSGLRDYQELLVGAQIVLNAYAPCLFVLAGVLSGVAVSDHAERALRGEWAARRAVSLLGCQLALYGFRSHLFVWSIFAPRFLFECAHLAVTLVVAAGASATTTTR